MFKKLALLLSLALTVPFAFTVAELANDSASVVFADEEETQGECLGYTYTQKGINRYYDSHDFVPDIVANFWAPSGYKFTLNYTDEQLGRVLDQAEACGINYSYVDFILRYKKFGMDIYLESFINDFNNREECHEWVKDKFNNFAPFYETKGITTETDLVVEIQFYFTTGDASMEFHFEGDVFNVKPFDASDYISLRTFCYDNPEEDDRRITISSEPINGFFYEPPTYNQYGFHTDEVEGKYIQTPESYSYYDDCASFKITLFAYGSVEIGDLTYSGLEVTYPSRPLPVSAKLEFESGGQHYEFWSKDFVIGDPNIRITIDGYDDRSSVQSFSEHNYALNFDTYDDRVIYSISTQATAYPSRLLKSDNLIEYYDLAIAPALASNYYLRGSFDDWAAPKEEYSFQKVDDNHYVLHNMPLRAGDSVNANLGYGDRYYSNVDTWEDCHFTINSWENLEITDTGLYDIDLYLQEPNDNHVRFTFLGDIPEYTAPFNLNVSSLSSAIKLNQDDLGESHYQALGVTLKEGDVISVSDSASHSFTNSKAWECAGFKVENGKVIVTKTAKYDVDFYPYSTRDAYIILHEKPLPSEGDKNFLYYVANPEEVRLHHQGKDEEFLNEPAAGQYARWDEETKRFVNFEGITLLDFSSDEYEEGSDYLSLANNTTHLDWIGDWIIMHHFMASTSMGEYYFQSSLQKLEVSSRDKTGDYIVLKTNDSEEPLPDEINLLNGGDKTELIPYVPSHEEGIRYYYDYEIDKEGIVEVEEGEDGKLTLTTLNAGVVNITFSVECELFSKITKTVSVRVLDAIYDVAKITVDDEFHYAGKDLTAYLSIRGFTRIQNINVDWEVTTKGGEKLDKAKMRVNRDATITLIETDSEDYTFSAYYEGIKLDQITVQVRYTDLNKFLRTNIWWIFLITVSFVTLLFFINYITKRSKTTVESIERVYQVFCQCLSDDKLTKEELMTIKKEITKCLHRCEDLNIDALNQYEKATRYLRKSLFDVKELIRVYDTTSPMDRGVYTEKLNQDLGKALSVAREIENAKGLIEQYHNKANRQNYEVLKDDDSSNKDRK